MSTKNTLDFLNHLHDSLSSRGSTQLYRDLVANKRVHIFKFNSISMANQMKIELENNKNFSGLTQKDRQVINSLAQDMKVSLAKTLEKLSKQNPASKYRETKNTLQFRFDENTGTHKVITLRSGKTIEISPDDVFRTLKDTYRPALKDFFDGVQNHLKSTTEVNPETGRMRHRALRTKTGKTAQAPGKYLHAGHEKGAGIFESFLRDAFEGIAEATGSDSKATKNDLAHVLGVETLLILVRNDKEDSHTISIESRYLNTMAKEGGVDISTLRGQLKKELKAAINKVQKALDLGEGIEGLQGSDSIKSKKRKQTLSKTLEPFKKLKNVTVKSEDLKIKSKSYKRKRKAPKPTAAAQAVAVSGKGVKATRGVQRTKGTTSPAASPLKLITMLNKELPNVVRNNMKAPALVNRTGTFAESVKVTDIQQTPKGFPTIGYTYKRDPYEVFEMGSQGSWSSPERDPRKLIEGSIREIAANMAMGRFYMRRT